MRPLIRLGVALSAICLLLVFVFAGSHPSNPTPQSASTVNVVKSSINAYIPNRLKAKFAFKVHDSDAALEQLQLLAGARKNRRFAITSSVQTASFTGLAMNLGYSIQKYNDLSALDADLVLLVRAQVNGDDGVTPQNITNLEKVGWRVKEAEGIDFDGVDIDKIRPWHKHNLNKLHLWSWTQYEKVIFIDADVLCKGALKELLLMPGDTLAAAPDVWWDKLTDNKFNSGVISFKPNMEEFRALVEAVSDPKMHAPNDADQALLNNYYQFRYYGLPYKYNFNLVMYHYHRESWDLLWDEAVLVHFTTRKPRPDKKKWCRKTCAETKVLEWYTQVYQEMMAYHGFTEEDIPILG